MCQPQMAAVTKRVEKPNLSLIEKQTIGGSPSPWKMSLKAKESGEDNRGSYEDLLQAALHPSSQG